MQCGDVAPLNEKEYVALSGKSPGKARKWIANP
jgi:hypothetical protein